MTVGPLVVDVVVTFFLAFSIIYRYINWRRHHVIVKFAVLTGWYFSFLIIFVLPLDVSSTVYRQCLKKNNVTESENTTSTVCREPWSYVGNDLYLHLWHIVYWTSQCLTWLVLPLMQSYIKAGDFTIRGKLKSALIDNAIYYGSYLFICVILIIYIAVRPSRYFYGQNLKTIASSASNTWGLFLLILLLGYALVAVPRSLWNASKKGYSLNYAYFKAGKLSLEKLEAEEALDDVLETLLGVKMSVTPGHPSYKNVETILQKLPMELQDRMCRRQLPDDAPLDTPSEKALVRLHRQVIKTLQTYHRTETQWTILVEKIFELEDIAYNQENRDHVFRPTFRPVRPALLNLIYTPTIEWYWKCVLQNYILKLMAVVTGLLSVAVVWSEVTFFNKEPVLSLFAEFINLAAASYDYATIEVLSTLVIAYLCYCAYSTVLKIKFLNLYYLAPHHQTDEYSLIFSGMMLCRLTPPICLNFLGLIHMDSHVIKTHIMETYYTQVMGHMDVVPIISDGFNVYFPIAVLAFCLATYFNVGSRIVSWIGFHQFLGDEETADLVADGRAHIRREMRRRQRVEDSVNRRKAYEERLQDSTRYRSSREAADERVQPLHREDSGESARAVLLRDVEPVDYVETVPARRFTQGRNQYYTNVELESNENSVHTHTDDTLLYQNGSESVIEPAFGYQTSRDRHGLPPRGLFDDV
ncbi:LMBR1 domain-containing protein 2 homolog isoform X1 [Schistocerca gregaria]|uniref:LMBR1 domain-containing protein 2 homolog isoform X1 n=1 Tax=Schistocerca gregaria TaxID=7010 RepID=UPI00211E1002|nr:LMBR1 domain-containing protein 2 homolog isoform X1 [Schistocerca gregaria]